MGTGLSFVILLIILGLLAAAMRRGPSAVREKPNRLVSFATSMPLADVIKAVIRYAQSNGYEISDISREDQLIVGEPPALTTWGFFYPIYLSERPDANTSVEVGIKSKVFQVGPVVARSHENFVNGVKAAILADGGTVDEHDASEPRFDRERRETAWKTVEQPQRYCPSCGADVRTGNAFCVSCGERLNAEGATRPVVRGSGSRNQSLLDQGNKKIALYIGGALLLLIIAYLLFSYSMPLGFLLIGLSVLAVLVIRKNRGRQTRLEQQVLERAGRYGGSARKAYEEGEHRKFAQNAYQHSREAYEEANARYRDWSESWAAGRERPPAPNTGVPLLSALQSVPRNLLRRIKSLPIILKVAIVVVGALLLLTILSPLGFLAAAISSTIGVAGLVLRVSQRRSVKDWEIVTAVSLVLAVTFGVVSYELYGARSSGFSTAESNGVQSQADTSKQGSLPRTNDGPSPQLQQAMTIVRNEPSFISMFSPELLNSKGVYDNSGNLSEKGKSLVAKALCRGVTYAVSNTSAGANRDQPVDPSKFSAEDKTNIAFNLQSVALPIPVDLTLTWAQACQKDPQDWWRHA